MTKAERQKQKVQELSTMLEEGVRDLRTSEDWQEMLATAAKFHRYSFSNQMLIWLQDPTATRVAGYRKWQEMGRQVRRGETAIKIFAPRIVKVENEETGEKEKKLIGFLVVNVFDIAQTDGEDIPSVSDFVVEIEDDAPVGGIEMVTTLIEKHGYSVTLEEIDGPDGPAGYTSPAEKKVVVRDEMAEGAIWKTLVHELAHVELHAENDERPDCRGSVEVEAESVAFIVSAALGVPSETYSFGYVGIWAERATDPKAVENAMKRVQKTAASILEAF